MFLKEHTVKTNALLRGGAENIQLNGIVEGCPKASTCTRLMVFGDPIEDLYPELLYF